MCDDSVKDKTNYSALNNLIQNIYSLRIHRDEARRLLQTYHQQLRNDFVTLRQRVHHTTQYIFPLQNYNYRHIGGSNGEGFVGEKSYDFFDGNAHKGHPALDIFVYDRNQDCIDDRTKKPVSVVAVSDGVILCTNSEWSKDSVDAHNQIQRGGKYFFLYSYLEDVLWYYAHLNTIIVKPGQIVKAGEVLGTVGRTGASAIMKRSPTHLHIMLLEWKEEKLIPMNPVDYLKTSSTK